MTFQLTTQPRDAHKDNAELRAEGLIPAVYYGGGVDSTPITVDYLEFVKLYKEAGESSLIDIDTASGSQSVLVQDLQQDPVSGKVIHVDFKVIEKGKTIEVTIPLEFIGVAPAVKNGLGSLTKVLQEVDIEVLPSELPSELEVDISVLEDADGQILVKDIPLAKGTFITDPESVVAVITAAREEEDEEESEAIDFSQIQVEKKGKEETEEENEG